MRSLFLIFFAILSFSCLAQEKTLMKEAVVLELFTSEGCSSCPPFEKLAEILSKKYGNRLLVLSQHVDYWDYLGWIDRFASSVHTARQSKYKSHFNARYLVTPQFIGNGKEIVEGNYVQDWIEKQLKKTSLSQLDIEVNLCENKQFCVDYQIDGSITNKELYIALIENNIYSNVTAGENRGKTYNHQNVVRHLEHIPLENVKGTYSYRIPKNIDLKNCELAVFLQDTKNLDISSAQVKKLL